MRLKAKLYEEVFMLILGLLPLQRTKRPLDPDHASTLLHGAPKQAVLATSGFLFDVFVQAVRSAIVQTQQLYLETNCQARPL